MTFGERVRELRKAKDLTLREVAAKVGINFTYLSKIENGKLDFSDFPSEKLIRKLAKVLGAEEEELLLLAQKVPDSIKQQVMKRPDVFRKMAGLDDKGLDEIEKNIDDLLQGMDPCDEDNPKS
jgi:HTH-type transcriptional regulator, competence development regulator